MMMKKETNRPSSLCFANSALLFDLRTLLQLILKQTKNRQAKKLFFVFLFFCVINKQPEIQKGRKVIGFCFLSEHNDVKNIHILKLVYCQLRTQVKRGYPTDPQSNPKIIAFKKYWSPSDNQNYNPNIKKIRRRVQSGTAEVFVTHKWRTQNLVKWSWYERVNCSHSGRYSGEWPAYLDDSVVKIKLWECTLDITWICCSCLTKIQ